MIKTFFMYPKYKLLILIFLLTAETRGQDQPNILFIISDDHAIQTIDAYSGKYDISPNIDRIAKEGAIFKNAFVTNSLCAPSRAVMLTGKYSHVNGHRDNRTQFDASQDVFPRRLQKGGYQTAWIGKWHLKVRPQGFDYWEIVPGQGYYYNPDFVSSAGDTLRREGYITNVTTGLAVDWLEHREKDKPFFLVVGHKATHRTWMPDLQDLGRFDSLSFDLPENFWDDYKGRKAAEHQNMSISKTLLMDYDLKLEADKGFGKHNYLRFTPAQEEKWNAYYDKIGEAFEKKDLSGKALIKWKFQRYMRDYLSTAVSLDRNIGQLLDYLDEHDLARNTIVIYTSDQGFYMGEHGWFDKRFMYEESMRMPFVMRYPGTIQPGTAIEEMVVNIDFAPTLLDAAHLAVPPAIQGESILPLLEGSNTSWREAAYYHYYEYPGEHMVMPHFGIRTERYKLIYFYGHGEFWELYDLKKDPGEMNNIYGKDKFKRLTARLKDRLNALIDKYGDEQAKQRLQNSEI